MVNDNLGKIWKERFLALLEMSRNLPGIIEERNEILSGGFEFNAEIETLFQTTCQAK
jgi:hypothetical protein